MYKRTDPSKQDCAFDTQHVEEEEEVMFPVC
jgi:hypothetical protein